MHSSTHLQQHSTYAMPFCSAICSSTAHKPRLSAVLSAVSQNTSCQETSLCRCQAQLLLQKRSPLKTNSATPVCLPGEGWGSLGWLGPWQTIFWVTMAPLRLSVTTCCAGCHFSRLVTCRVMNALHKCTSYSQHLHLGSHLPHRPTSTTEPCCTALLDPRTGQHIKQQPMSLQTR